MNRKKQPSVAETILENLSPNDLLALVQNEYIIENEPSEFNIGDIVQVLNDSKDRLFTIYSYTTYKDGRKEYTIWSEGEYLQYEHWQLVRPAKKNPIGFYPKTSGQEE